MRFMSLTTGALSDSCTVIDSGWVVWTSWMALAKSDRAAVSRCSACRSGAYVDAIASSTCDGAASSNATRRPPQNAIACSAARSVGSLVATINWLCSVRRGNTRNRRATASGNSFVMRSFAEPNSAGLMRRCRATLLASSRSVNLQARATVAQASSTGALE